MKQFVTFTIFLLCFVAAPVTAQPESSTISPLSPGDIEFMEKQRKNIDDLARRYLGMRLRQNRQNDLEVLQKLLDQKLVKQEDRLQLQAMGVILGDFYIKQLGVRWVVLEDKMGRSRALQAGQQQQLLFPITMISRRVEAGIQVNVNEIYNKGYKILEPLVQRGVYRR